MKKVCIISVSLGKGGLERSCANLSQLLSDNGFDVHLVILYDDVDYEYKGTLFNFGKYKTENDSLLKRLKRFRKLRRYFRKHKFDYVIDNRIGNQPWRELYYMFYIYGLRQKVVYVQHSGRLTNHMPEPSLITNLIVSYADRIIGVSKGITNAFNNQYNTYKCQTIYNFIQPLESVEYDFDLPNNYIIFLGRIEEDAKNLSLLINAYKKSKLSPDYKLLIMGGGDKYDLALLDKMIISLGLDSSVEVRAYSSNIFKLLSGARFLVLSSRYEGFPMVLVEALSVGTPVVSVDCDYGPSEIIQNEHNGLLVENHNPQILAEAMNRMVCDEVLYNYIKSNTKGSVKFLDREIIADYWRRILA